MAGRATVSEGRRPGIIVIPGRRARRARRPGSRSTPPTPRVAARRHRGISPGRCSRPWGRGGYKKRHPGGDAFFSELSESLLHIYFGNFVALATDINTVFGVSNTNTLEVIVFYSSFACLNILNTGRCCDK